LKKEAKNQGFELALESQDWEIRESKGTKRKKLLDESVKEGAKSDL